MYIYIYIYMMQGCHTPPPPPHPMVSPLACQVGSCLVWPCCFPRLVLFGPRPLSPPPCGVGPVVFLVGPAPFYRRMVWLLPLVCSNVIVTCLVPSPPVWWGLWSFWLAPPRPACVGQCVLQRYVWYGCCRLLAVMSSLRARYHTKLLFSPCKRMQFILHRPIPWYPPPPPPAPPAEATPLIPANSHTSSA